MSESKCFEELFCSVHVWTFFQKGGGGCLIPNCLRNFSACVWKFFREGGGLPYSKTFEELFSLSLDIFQEDGGGCLIPKMMRYFFLLWLRHFPRKMGEDDQYLNTLRNFSSYKIRI